MSAGAIGGDTEVGGQGQHRPRAGGGAVERGNDRLVEPAHVLDHRAGHAGERQVFLEPLIEQGADDRMHVTAGAEALTGPGEHHYLHRIVVAQILKEVAQLGVDLEGEGIQHLGPVESDRSDLLAHLVEEVVAHTYRPSRRVRVSGVSRQRSPRPAARIVLASLVVIT
jgi:hypothetical protein